MKKVFISCLCGLFLIGGAAEAGRISNACQASDRKAATASLCSCIERVAKRSLKRRDQRLVVKIFKKPDLAQETRQSDDPRKEAFWKRYKSFSSAAAKQCKR